MEDAYKFLERDDIFLAADSERITLDFTQDTLGDKTV